MKVYELKTTGAQINDRFRKPFLLSFAENSKGILFPPSRMEGLWPTQEPAVT